MREMSWEASRLLYMAGCTLKHQQNHTLLVNFKISTQRLSKQAYRKYQKAQKTVFFFLFCRVTPFIILKVMSLLQVAQQKNNNLTNKTDTEFLSVPLAFHVCDFIPPVQSKCSPSGGVQRMWRLKFPLLKSQTCQCILLSLMLGGLNKTVCIVYTSAFPVHSNSVVVVYLLILFKFKHSNIRIV